MSDTAKFRRVNSYDDVTPYFDNDYNRPSIPEELAEDDFEAEFNAAHDTLVKHLSTVGTATENSSDDADFSLYRYVSVRRAINVVSEKFDYSVILAVQNAQMELPSDYAINLDSDPAYISILPGGEVLGYAEDAEGAKILDGYGFP